MKLRPFQTTILEEKDGILRPPTLPSNLACFGLSMASSLPSSLQTGSQVKRGEKENFRELEGGGGVQTKISGTAF